MPAPFDVDDTLIMSSEDQKNIPLEHQIMVIDPITERNLWYRINLPMVRLLKEEYAKGSCVIVWSRGGYEWAEAVVKALGLESMVTFVMEKPVAYYDDKDIKEWLPYRVYIGPDTRYKNR